MQPLVAEAVTISMRLGYTLAPLGAHPTLNTHHRFPSSLGASLDTPLLPARLGENLQSDMSKEPLQTDPKSKCLGSIKGSHLVMFS